MTIMFQNGPAALISALYEELNFGKIIDRMVNRDEKRCHYLKKPSRVEALAYLLLIALLIFYILQRRVRKALETEDRPLLMPGKVETFKPTGTKILESVEVILTMTTGDPHRRAFSTNYKLPRVIGLAGFDGNT